MNKQKNDKLLFIFLINHIVFYLLYKRKLFSFFLLPASIFPKFKLPSLIYHFRSHTYPEFMLSII